ncbi:DUF819 domain-containing protein [Halobacillus litoralis]|uniref:DUF819 family protein n=1 Tax=Halobacillus litoralis TaxID=45668 RepID=UPI001CFED3EC|nr:DUF819 family protein [Halobacillus litoralis]
MEQTLIQADDTWLLWAFLAGWAAVSIYLEQKYEWASKVTGAIIALAGALILANLKIIPTDAPAYDAVWTYVIPLAIPLLLFQANLKKVLNESGRMLFIFLISAVGTVIGAYLAFFLLKDTIPELEKIGAMETGSYIGGGVNFAALSGKLNPPGELAASAIVADNLLMALYFFVLILMPTLSFFRKQFRTPYIDEREQTSNPAENTAADYWKRKDISLKDLALASGSAFVLVGLSFKLAEWMDGLIPSGEQASFFLNFLNGLLGDGYLMLTTITVFAVTTFSRFFEKIHGAQELGTYLIYIFFVVIGVPASIPLLINNAPLLVVFVGIIVFFNMIVTFGIGRFFKFSLEEMIVASNANVGGPTTAAAFAIAKGWTKLIVPIMLVGTLGYIIGNYIGSMMYYVFLSM